MGLHRTLLRLSTIESLRPAALLDTQGPWPTLAGARVFDTRIDPFDDLKPGDEPKAVIAVYTEHDQGYGNQKRGGPAFRREVDLVFEISQIASATVDGDQFVAGIPQTDNELEASLDLIEFQIERALYFSSNGLKVRRGGRQSGSEWVGGELITLWRYLTGSMVSEPRSMPHRTSEEAVKLAARTITWKVQMIADVAADLTPPGGVAGLDRFPGELRRVAQVLATSPAYAPLINGLADDVPVRAPLPQLASVGMNYELLRPGQTRTGDANLTDLIAFPVWTWRN